MMWSTRASGITRPFSCGLTEQQSSKLTAKRDSMFAPAPTPNPMNDFTLHNKTINYTVTIVIITKINCKLPCCSCKFAFHSCKLPYCNCKLPHHNCKLPCCSCKLFFHNCKLTYSKLPCHNCTWYYKASSFSANVQVFRCGCH